MIDRLLFTLWSALADFYLEKNESMNLERIPYGSTEITITVNDVTYIISIRQKEL